MRLTHLLCAVILCAVACGGDGSTVAPPDNTPATLTLSPNTPLTLASGATATITATVLTKDGRSLGSSGVSWSTSDASVASVNGGTVVAARVGTATITASISGLTASLGVTVTPGAAAALALRTQPVGSASGSPLAIQPVIEVHDLAGNIVTTSTAVVTVAIASGGGTLGGATSVAAVGGVATFTNLSITGSAGDRTLTFTSPGLTSVTSGAVTITVPPTAVLAVDNNAVAVATTSGTNPASIRLNVTNAGSIVASGLTVDSPTYDAGQATGWLSVALAGTAAPTTITLTIASSTLPVGVYHAVFHLASSNATNSPLTISVTLTVNAFSSVAYGTSADRIKVVDIGTSYLPTTTITGSGGSISYSSRAPGIVTVGSDGRVTAKAAGDAWVVASNGQAADSIFVIVPVNSTGPVLRASITNYSFKVGDTATVTIVLDTRGTTVGAGAFAMNDLTPFTWVSLTTPNTVPAPTVTIDAGSGVVRIAVGSATGMTGVVSLVTLKLKAQAAGGGYVYLNALDLSAVDGTNLTTVTSATRVPVVFK